MNNPDPPRNLQTISEREISLLCFLIRVTPIEDKELNFILSNTYILRAELNATNILSDAEYELLERYCREHYIDLNASINNIMEQRRLRETKDDLTLDVKSHRIQL